MMMGFSGVYAKIRTTRVDHFYPLFLDIDRP
jgi:hypothetical protein